jgi:hypothetical protein
MKNTRFRISSASCSVVFSGLLAAGIAVAQPPSVAELIPLTQKGSSEVAAPGQVNSNAAEKSVSAATAQDGANAALGEVKKELSDNPALNSGARVFEFPSGSGFLSTGVATYPITANPVFTRKAKRVAYFQAYMHAKSNLAKFGKGVLIKGDDLSAETMERFSDPDQDATNVSTTAASRIEQTVQRMLRGHVVYEVSDSPKKDSGVVYVSIAVTPATCSKTNRRAAGVWESQDLAKALEEVVAEVASDVVPPLGARIIRERASGEVCCVGFGSSVVGVNADEAIQAKMEAEALRVAEMYAHDSLCGLLHGDQTCWTGGVVSKHAQNHREFVQLADADAQNALGDGKIEVLGKAVKEMMDLQVSKDVVESSRSGALPPGVTIKKWFDKDHNWAYAIAVYMPSMTAKVRDLGKMMDDANLLDEDDGPVPGAAGADGKGGAAKSRVPVEVGPTGKVGGKDL